MIHEICGLEANGSIRSTAIIEIVTIKLLAWFTLHHLLGHNVLVCALSRWNIVAGTLRFSGYNFARSPNSVV